MPYEAVRAHLWLEVPDLPYDDGPYSRAYRFAWTRRLRAGMAEVGVVFELDACSGENSEDDVAVERARRTMRQLSSEPETICFMLGLNASDVTTSR